MSGARCPALYDPETLCPLRSKKKYREDSLKHPKWEVLDPTPNIQQLFKEFNRKFFDGEIRNVTVVWGKLMSDAGVTFFNARSGRDYDCRIVLSAPLLRFRPRGDLIDTLLHEMIHAYLFVTFNEKDRNEHGTQFKRHMHRINAAAGTNIKIYHNYHAEVDLYTKQHWWRCNGPCQKWTPNFGLVRRQRNKPPGPSDKWWKEHSQKCGGKFIKVREPGDMEAKPVKMIRKPKVQTKASTSKPRRRTSARHGLIPENEDSASERTSPCPVCENHVEMDFLNDHLDGCLENKHFRDCVICGGSIELNLYEEHVSKCAEDKFGAKDRNGSFHCPVCQADIPARYYDAHVDQCTQGLLDRKRLNRIHFVHGDNFDEHATTCAKDRNEIFHCPVCQTDIPAGYYNAHVEQCTQGLLDKYDRKCGRFSDDVDVNFCNICKNFVHGDNFDEHIANCLHRMLKQKQNLEDSACETYSVKTDSASISCESCNMNIHVEEYEAHIEQCTSKAFGDIGESQSDPQCRSEKIYCDICKEILPSDRYDAHLESCIAKMFEQDTEVTNCIVCSKSILKAELGIHLENCEGLKMIFDSKDVMEQGQSDNDDDECICPVCTTTIPSECINEHIDVCLKN